MSPDEVLKNASKLFKEKARVYGDNWKQIGPILNILFPHGLLGSIKHMDKLHLIVMILVKLTRYAEGVNNGKDHKDSTRDLVVYAEMLDSLSDIKMKLESDHTKTYKLIKGE